MMQRMSRQRFLGWISLCLVLCTPLPAFADMPKTIGPLDSKDALVFEGNRSFPKDQICTALYSDKDVILAISPAASLQDYLAVLESKVRLGYLHDGFPSPTVRASYVDQPEHILITIEEGPRYSKGDLVIEGASETLKNALSQSLNKLEIIKDASPDESELLESLGITSAVAKPISSDELKTFEANLAQGIHKTFLASKGRPSFAPSLPRTSKAYLDTLLKVLGYYRCEFTIELDADPSEQTASPHIIFQNEGVRAQIGVINIVGNTINSNEQILSCLGVETGQPLNEMLTQTLQAKLINSGRFRFVTVLSEINMDDPPQSTLHISVEEVERATPLDGTLTEKEELMQKVGRFIDRYQSWERDVRIRIDVEQVANGLSAETLQTIQNKMGMSLPDFEIIYSSRQGVILTELINDTDSLNTYIITPEQMRYSCPLLGQNVIAPAMETGLLVVFNAGPSKPESLQDQTKWFMSFGMGIDSDIDQYTTQINIHPGVWFNMANDPEKEITFIDETRAQIQNNDLIIHIDRQNGEIDKIESDQVTVTFEKDLFDSFREQLENRCRETNLNTTNLASPFAVLLNSVLPLYLSHTPNDPMTTEQQIEAAHTWQQFLSGFADCQSSSEDALSLEDTFSLPMDEQLATVGIVPMLLANAYQSCHDNLPRDSWIRPLLHAAVLMTSGYAQHPSVGQDLQQVYNSDQVGPIGYLMTAQFLGQLGYPASKAFALRGLQVLDAEHFRKDWQPLLTKESEMKQSLLCYLEQLQTGSDEGVRLISSLLPGQYGSLLTALLERLREVQIDRLEESLDPVLTNFWETTLKEQLRQQLIEL